MHRNNNRNREAVIAKGDEKGNGGSKGRLKAALIGLACMMLTAELLVLLITAAYKYVNAAADGGKKTPVGISLFIEDQPEFFYPGDELSVGVGFTPEDAERPELEWRSSDEAVAAAEQDGTVRAVSEGEAVIYAALPDGTEADISVTVSKRPVSAHFSEEEKAIRVGESYTPELIVEPGDAAFAEPEFASSDEEVIVYEGGSVTAAGRGKAWLTASINGGLTARMGVFVYEHEFDVLAEVITSRGEQDKASDCWFLALDKSDIAEEELHFTKYVELVYYPNDDLITVCCDIYDENLYFYYETIVGFSRGDRQNADLLFRCALEGGMSSHHTIPLSSGGASFTGMGGISLSGYTPGDRVGFDSCEGEPAFRETAEGIAGSMLGYAFGIVSDKWDGLGIPFDIERTLGLKGV